jgi:hypothetical protein
LYRNRGDGTFEDVTDVAGVGDPRWSTSAAFADYDRDGDLDLYVANYLHINFEQLPPKSCRHGEAIVLCGPMGLPGVADVLYRNNGDGTFSDVSETSGAQDRERAYGLSVLWADFDNDGDPDIYVGNDATPNLLFVNQGDGSFVEQGLLSGLAVNAEGREQATMGIDAADYDNDGWLDLYLTHFSDDYSTLYHNEGDLQFRDVTAQARTMQGEIGRVSWGTRFVDFDCDGYKDIFHTNGHVYPYLLGAQGYETFDEPETLYMNQGDGTFRNASSAAGSDFNTPRLSRGAAIGDYDNDGDFDLLIVHLNDRPSLLRTDRTDTNHWIMLRTRSAEGNREGIGARISVLTGDREQVWEVKRAGSIYSASDPRAHFGLGSAALVERLRIRWPSGKIQEFVDVEADRHYILDEQQGLRLEFGDKDD